MGAWDDSPAVTSGGGWEPHKTAETNGDGWQPDGDAGADGDGFTGISQENISKHAGDAGCRHCGADSHFARDCPDKGEGGGGGFTGECFNCGEVGHNKADCPNPKVEREFTGTCRVCEQVGHRAADCPEKPPPICNLCKAEGHISTECTVNRLVFGVETMDAEDAWKAFEIADKEGDSQDIKNALFAYAKAYPGLTFEELEASLRESSMRTHLIAKEQEISDTHTIVNLQGKTDQKYIVSIQFGAKPRRAAFAEGWPKTPEENIARLAEAGFPLDGLQSKCTNCNALGHIAKKCPEEKQEKDQPVIKCGNCEEVGHRYRDCPQPRKAERGPRACKNCGSTEHMAKECPEPPNPDNFECRNCGETGHFSRDCPTKEPEICRNCYQEGHRAKDCENERVMKCRNCDEIGHSGKECPKPKDWSRVECSNCHKKGHGKARCPKPPQENEDDGFGDAAGGGGDWGAPAKASGGW